MNDHEKTREQLLAELQALRSRVAQLERERAECERAVRDHRTGEDHYRRVIETATDPELGRRDFQRPVRYDGKGRPAGRTIPGRIGPGGGDLPDGRTAPAASGREESRCV